jgi:hypothetical protein
MKKSVGVSLFTLVCWGICFACLFILSSGYYIEIMKDVYVVSLICAVSIVAGMISSLYLINLLSFQPWFGIVKLPEPKKFCILHPDHFKVVIESASMWSKIATKDYGRVSGYRENLFTKIDGYIVLGFKLNKPQNEIDFDFFNPVPAVTIFVTTEFYEEINAEMKDNAWKGYLVEVSGRGTAYEKLCDNNLSRFVYFVNRKISPMAQRNVDNLESVTTFVANLD